jgi:hypothetical protein
MKKLNLICASIAVLFSAGAAHAGTAAATATKIAIENFGGTAASQDTLAVLGAPVTYSMSSITAVNNGSVVYFTVRLAGGKFAAAPAAAAFTFGGQACIAGAATSSNPNCVVTSSADRSTIKVAITTGTSYTLGLGAFTWTPVTTDIDSVNTVLGTVGGKVTASIGLVTVNPASIQATATQDTLDGALGTADLAVAAKAITGVVAASSYAGKIDLTVSPAGSDFTTAGYAILGSYKFTNAAAGTGKIRTGASDYTLANGSATTANTGATVVVTPSAALPVGSVLTLSSSATCASALAGAGNTATVAAASAAAAKTLVTTDAVVSATEYYVCMTKPTSPNLATPVQATITATVAPAATTDFIGGAAGNGYNLGYNGSQIDINAYWPGALTTAGYNGYVRIMNTGSVSAPISAAHINPTTGVVGSSSVLTLPAPFVGNMLPAGAHVMLATKDIDAILGAAPSGYTAGRLRVTAPTNGMKVQSFIQTGAAAPQETSGAQ